jgi:hypothetical protein
VESVRAENPGEKSETSLNVGGYAAAYPHVVAALKPFRAPEALSVVAGLLTIPDLQANCFRLEVLAHLAAAFCRGRISPTPTQIKFLFDSLDEGRCGGFEDPAESVFVGLVNTPRGNFRIFEGLWQGTSFYLQLILDVLEAAPAEDDFDLMRRSINSLLRLSEAVADRAGVAEYELGRENPIATLSDEITASLPLTSAHATFDSDDLKALGIDLDDLSPFVFDPASGSALLNQEVGNSDLERYPLALCDERLTLVIPTAVAAVIIRFVIESVKFLRIERKFERAFASKVVTLLLPYSVKAEIEHPSAPAEKKRKAMAFLYSMEVSLTPPELATHERLRMLIQGNAKSGRHHRDAFHLVESAKYGGRYFITKDRRLLKKAPEIWAALRLLVVRPSEFLSAYRLHSSAPR